MHQSISSNAFNNKSFSAFVPTVNRRHPSQRLTFDRSRTMILLFLRYSYNVFGFLTLTSRKLASEGKTFKTQGNLSNSLEILPLSPSISSIHLTFASL